MLAAFLLAGSGYDLCFAERLESMNFRSSAFGTEKPTWTPETRDQYLCAGKEYLRSYMRQNLVRFMADQGMLADESDAPASASIDLAEFYRVDFLLGTKVRFMADDDLQNYLFCGRFLPVKIEMESSWPLWKDIQLRARMQAPFNDLLKVEVGSSFAGPGPLTSKLLYTFANSSQVYAGMNIGLGMELQPWHLEYECHLTPGTAQMQRLTLDRSF